MMYVMGVIQSRRLGRSLGLDVVGADGVKRCNFNCVYCEVGNGKYETNRGKYADFEVAIAELKEAINDDVDIITFSGNGEPTLNIELERYIDEIHAICDKPVCVITNSSTLMDPEVVNALKKADVVMPSIDACIDRSFLKIDRPRGIDLDEIKRSILEFSKIYVGKLFLEILFVKSFNDGESDLRLLKEFVKEVKPTELHINTIDRLPAEDVERYSYEEKLKIYEFFNELDTTVKLF